MTLFVLPWVWYRATPNPQQEEKQWIYWKIERSCEFTAVLILLQGFMGKVNPGTERTADDNGLAHFYGIF
jgi:hypothetical protein